MRYSIIASITLVLYSAVNALSIPTDEDMLTMITRRIESVKTSSTASSSNINTWKTTLKSTGTWDNVDYTAGCDGRVANWPAGNHLARTRSLASAWLAKPDATLLTKTKLALDYWFKNDFIPLDCVDSGGKAGKNCPCGTPGLWNKNWFDQVILIPDLIGDICLLLKGNLSTSQKASCIKIQSRAFDKITGKTGANLLDISSIGISLALFNDDADYLKNALEKFYGGVFINPVTAADGIQSDGSFMQHAGLLYSGNYGKDYINDLISVFVETKGTNLIPSKSVQTAFENLMSGSEWMIMADAKLDKLLWQYSVIGRMISFKYSDKMASGGVAIDMKKVEESSEGWETEADFDKITDRLTAAHNIDANQGDLIGTRYFYNSDYMVHRAPNYITTMKMYSSRTVNSECVNAQNPFGFHLSDGAIYNYLSGDEYVDAFGTWNWNLVPGITVDVGGTPLTCSAVKKKGVKPFVGGATDGNTGIAVMDFQNPTNGNLNFQKTAFFFPSAYAIQIGPTDSKNATAQLVTVLDQRKRNGDIYLSGKLRNTNTTYSTVPSNSLWHDNIGYYFPTAETLYVDSKPKNADWASIGISSGTAEQQLWTSYVKHATKTTTGLLTQYVVQPNIQQSDFQANVNGGTIPISLAFHASDPQVNAAYSATDKSMGIAFWTPGTFETPWNSITVKTDGACALMLRQTANNVYRLTVADPSQTLATLKLTIKFGTISKSVTVTLPTGSDAGKDVVKTITLVTTTNAATTTKTTTTKTTTTKTTTTKTTTTKSTTTKSTTTKSTTTKSTTTNAIVTKASKASNTI